MRILYVLHQFYPEFGGGTEHITLHLARMAQKAGHHVQVLACTVEPAKAGGVVVDRPIAGSVQAVHEGVPVLLLPRLALPPTADIGFEVDEAVAEALAAWMAQQRFDLAHVTHMMRMGSALRAIQRNGLPYVLTLTDFFLPCSRINLVNLKGSLCQGPMEGARCSRDCLVPPWTAPAFSARYEQAAALLAGAAERCAPSEFVAQHYCDAFPGQPIRVLPHGIDLLRFALAAGAAPRERAAGAPLELLYAGALVEQKGVDVVLRALAQVPEARVHLTVAGGHFGNSGYHAEVRQLAAKDPRVEIVGQLAPAQLFARMLQSDLLCLPSRIPESFSLVVHEAAAAGVPALVSDLGAPAGFVRRHDCGQAIAAGDVPAWAKAIRDAAGAPERLAQWRERLPLPLRMEEEAFFYESLYRRLQRARSD